MKRPRPLVVRTTALLVLAGCAETPTMKAFNTPPAVGITAPEDGTQFDQGVRIDFTALVNDDPTAPPDVALTWTSDRDGVLSDAIRADATRLTARVR